jgi:O-antigen/teichoic acid export membrane protein
MNFNINNTLKSFALRGGLWVSVSMVISKILNFALSILIIRFIAKDIYGNISYAMSVIQIFLPIAGIGLHHSLLRFGAIESSSDNKNNLFIKFLVYGSFLSIMLIVGLNLSSNIICLRLPNSRVYLNLLSPVILSYFLSELLFSFFRIHKDNKTYSWGMTLKALVLFVLCLIAAIEFGGKGYVIAYSVTPFLVMLVMLVIANRHYKIKVIKKEKLKISKYLKYGLWVGVGSIASQLVLLLDTIMVGNIIADSNQLAVYKVATIIPANLLFIPMVLLKTDYVYIAEKHLDRKFLINYYRKYLIIFISILIGILLIWFIFGNWIISIFGPEYARSKAIVSILMIMVSGAFLTRVPLGNIINAIGKSHWNSISNLVLLLVNFILNAVLIPKYGLTGAAVATSISIWISGFINIALFSNYLKKLKANQ